MTLCHYTIHILWENLYFQSKFSHTKYVFSFLDYKMDQLLKSVRTIQLNPRPHNDKQTNEHNDAPDGSMNWKRIGNEHFAFKRYKDAITVYTNRIKVGDKSIDMLANRSCAYLRLSNYKCALNDAQAALNLEKNHIKCIYRKVKALFGLTLYRDAITFLEKMQLASMPKDDAKVVIDLMAKGKCYIAQSENGNYPWDDIYKTKSVYHDMADYTTGVIIKEAPMKGRFLSKFDDPRNDFKKQNDVEIHRIFKSFERTREDAAELNLCLVDALIDFGKLRFASRMFMKSVDTFEKLYHLTKSVAAFKIVTILACNFIILSYANVNKLHMAKRWIVILKKETILCFGSLNILHVQFQDCITTMREFHLDI